MLDNKQITVLVTAIGTINGTAVIEELRKITESKVHIIGANCTPKEYVVNSKYVDEYFEFPMVTKDMDFYLNYLLAFCKEHFVSHLICFIDEEVELLTRNRSAFESIGVKLCLADHNTIFICHYKNVFSDWIKENIPAIWIKQYTDFEHISDDEFPLFAKPVEGRASAGCVEINSMMELQSFLRRNNNGEGYIVQKKEAGDVVGVDIIRNRSFNQVVSIQKKELMRNTNGCGTVVEIIEDTRLKEISRELAEKLDLNGLVNAEFFVSEDDVKIIEINPRLPAGTAYSCMAGGYTVINTLRIADGLPCVFDEIKLGTVYARRYETYEM